MGHVNLQQKSYQTIFDKAIASGLQCLINICANQDLQLEVFVQIVLSAIKMVDKFVDKLGNISLEFNSVSFKLNRHVEVQTKY